MEKKDSKISFAIALGLLALACIYYSYRLTKWLAYDDEGGYLYAAWRITEGEVPYRDFLTPQLPVFLYPGALVLKLGHYSVFAARLYMVGLVLGAALSLFLTVRNVWGDGAALCTLPLVLVQAEFFWAARFFRPEAPMLFWAMLGLYLFTRGYPTRDRSQLLLAGIALGLSMMAKLFGALIAAGVGLFVFIESVRLRDWKRLLHVGLWMGLPFLLVVVLISSLFLYLSPEFIADVLGHHLRQGRGTPWSQVLRKGLSLYRDFFRIQPAYIFLAFGGGAFSLYRQKRPMSLLFLCQVPTALAFLLMTRELQVRHLTYLVPSLAAMGGFFLDRVRTWEWPRRRSGGRLGIELALLIALGVALAPHVKYNAWVASWEEHDTEAWAAYLQRHTAPTDVVMSDYPGLNFYARRRTTPLAAGISRGAASSGQIMGADLIREIKQFDVQMVLLNVAQGAHQFVRLRDYPLFKHYIQTHFYLVGRRKYDYRLLEIYSKKDLWEGQRVEADFGHQLRLTGYRWVKEQAAPGESLQVMLRWQGIGKMPQDYYVTLQLLDEEGHLWGLGGKRLVDIDKDTYWDEEGLERAVLIPTSRWPEGETTVENFELPVKLATPPGKYCVKLRVHPKGVWNGLPLLDVAGAPAGYDFEIGQVWVKRATIQPRKEQLSIAVPLERDLAQVRLLGRSELPEQVRPGDTFLLSLYWQACVAPEEDYELELCLKGTQQVWGRKVLPLVRKDYPPSHWQRGEILRGQYSFRVDAETPGGDYVLRATLLTHGRRLASVDLGTLTVRGRDRLYQAPAFAHSLNVRFGQVITLLGYDLLQSQVAPGGTLELVLYWRAEDKIDVPYTVFTHLLDAHGRMKGQKDNEPVQGTYPTTGWLPGEIIIDRYTIPVDKEATPGSYSLEIGLYDEATGIRLPAFNPQEARLEADRVFLPGVVQVVGP
ncbi:MAG: phospholipid carrier-dependent glycosyltransferase [Anaerolineae bacterium]|nr:phospholipid carrier-dependent glycosyltransferase [Anaerolineae bacterium]